MDDTYHKITAMLCSIIAEIVDKTNYSSRFVTRLLSVLSSENIPSDRKQKIIHEMFIERFPDENIV